MTHLNLSEWGLRHRSMVAYLIIVMLVGGVFSYFKLGRAEDPDFTFKAMVVRTLWPGATAREVEQQVTERIEKKLQEVPWADVVRSNSKSGESLVFIILKDYTPKKDVPEAWYQVRKKLGDIRHTFPAGIRSSTTSSAIPSSTSSRLPATALIWRVCARRLTALPANCARSPM